MHHLLVIITHILKFILQLPTGSLVSGLTVSSRNNVSQDCPKRKADDSLADQNGGNTQSADNPAEGVASGEYLPHEHVVLVVLYPTQNSLFPIQKEVVANGPKKKKQKPSKTGSKRAERSVTPPSGENPFLG